MLGAAFGLLKNPVQDEGHLLLATQAFLLKHVGDSWPEQLRHDGGVGQDGEGVAGGEGALDERERGGGAKFQARFLHLETALECWGQRRHK